jgi:glycosyltransferase involved in cell wall biosynthesis
VRLLILTDSFAPKIDGVADTAGIIRRSLSQRGHEVTVIAPMPPVRSTDDAGVLRIPSFPMPTYAEVRISYQIGHLKRAIAAAAPDVALMLTMGPIGLFGAALLPKRTRLIHLYTTDMPAYLHAYGIGFLSGGLDRVLRTLGNRCAATLCPTDVVRDDLARRGVVRLGVWGRGVDTTLFRPERRSYAMRMRLTDGEPQRPLVLYVGRLAREKRILDLLEATRQLRTARFAFVGDGPMRPQLERVFPPDRTAFTGYLRGETLAEAFASADVFAFPSDTDTFAQVVLQALASAVPAVVAADTAPAQFVIPGVSGLHAPARSPREFAAAVARVVCDEPLQRRLASGALASVAERSWEALIDPLEALLVQPASSMDAFVR